jgi:hypothetical protein
VKASWGRSSSITRLICCANSSPSNEFMYRDIAVGGPAVATGQKLAQQQHSSDQNQRTRRKPSPWRHGIRPCIPPRPIHARREGNSWAILAGEFSKLESQSHREEALALNLEVRP